jgi:hypothetical protein
VKPWRSGSDNRLYVNDSSGRGLGYLHLATGRLQLNDPTDAGIVEAALLAFFDVHPSHARDL